MGWTSKIYVATTNYGVYYTNNFIDPTTQPTWLQINIGLASTNCKEFRLDPFHSEDRQYVLAGGIVYRREYEGNWQSILTAAEFDAVISNSGSIITSVTTDPSTDGKLWVLGGAPDVYTSPNGIYVIYSDDYGNNWSYGNLVVGSNTVYGIGRIYANGNNLWLNANPFTGNAGAIFYSYDGGLSWARFNVGMGGYTPIIYHNKLIPGRVYHIRSVDGYLLSRLDAGVNTNLNIAISRTGDIMWFDTINQNHQRAFNGSNLIVTNDDWSNINNIGSLGITPNCIAPNWGDNEKMLLGTNEGNHTILAVDGETTDYIGISGENVTISPYIDSIPYNANLCSYAPVWGASFPANIYTYNVEFEQEPNGGAVYPFGVDFGENGVGNGISVQNVDME